jgi:hypothetical protein
MGQRNWRRYRNHAIFSLDELVESFAQLGLQVAPQAAEGESMRLAGLLGDRRVISSLGGTKRDGAIHGWHRSWSLETRRQG